MSEYHIYSIGYQRRTAAQIADVRDVLDATLVDVRAKPVSRKPGFGGRQLEALVGPGNYRWLGNVLGGRGMMSRAGVDILRRETDRQMLLMCMEEAPGECHRHFDISCALLNLTPGYEYEVEVDVQHIFQDQLFLASDLQVAIINDVDEYDELEQPDDLAMVIAGHAPKQLRIR